MSNVKTRGAHYVQGKDTPGARAGVALFADPAHGRLVLMGGYNSMRTGCMTTGEFGDTYVLREVSKKSKPGSASAGERVPNPGATCDNCGKEASLAMKRCSGCLAAHYCSPSCQKVDWPRHKRECKEMGKKRQQGL